MASTNQTQSPFASIAIYLQCIIKTQAKQAKQLYLRLCTHFFPMGTCKNPFESSQIQAQKLIILNIRVPQY